jgi:protein-glutamine gamma-glutamyltransferase
MNLANRYYASLYLSLGLAVVALSYAEASLAIEVPFIGGLVTIALIFAYRVEGRWSLSLSNANLLGIGLFLFAGLWILFQIIRTNPDSLWKAIPWPTCLLPMLGPVLLMLIPAKLFRPKLIDDFWAMQALSLLTMALACTMNDDPFFAFLFGCWLITFIRSLLRFHHFAESEPHGQSSHLVEGSGRNRSEWRRSVGWAVLTGILGTLCFLITPRSTNQRWVLTETMRMETGLGGEGPVDLTRTGNLNVNREAVFKFDGVYPDGTPKLDLSPNIRFRSENLVEYQGGKWIRNPTLSVLQIYRRVRTVGLGDYLKPNETKLEVAKRILPDLGKDQFYLIFSQLTRDRMRPIQSDPVTWFPLLPPPLISVDSRSEPRWNGWIQSPEGAFNPITSHSSRDTWIQVCVPNASDLSSPMPLQMVGVSNQPNMERLLRLPNNLEKLKTHAMELLRGFVSSGRLPRQVLENLDPIKPRPNPVYHQEIARTFNEWFTRFGMFEYSLELDRQDRKLDPIEDFIFNTRKGHCERFATAMVLMLRAVGVPAQFILGYKGLEYLDEESSPGTYVIRQDLAHSWVEVLVPSKVIPDDDLPKDRIAYFQWYTLDPTPEVAAGEQAPVEDSNWLRDAPSRGLALIRDWIIGYNADIRAKLVQSVKAFFQQQIDDIQHGQLGYGWSVITIFLTVLFFVIRGILRRKPRDEAGISRLGAKKEASVPFLVQLLVQLDRLDCVPSSWETAQEFAVRAEARLHQEGLDAVASIPSEVAAGFYRIRFREEILPEEEVNELLESVEKLKAALDARLKTGA